MTDPPPQPERTDTTGGRGLDAAERAELLRLREQVAAQRAAANSRSPQGRRRLLPEWRSVVAAILIILGCILAPLSVVGIWARNQVTDTDRYVANVAPLASEPSVQQALTDRITNEIFSRIDIRGLVNDVVDALEAQGLPERATTALRGLAGSIESGARTFVRDRVENVVTSDVFEQSWIDANRAAHESFVALMEGDTEGAATIENGAVTIDLAVFINVVKQNLIDAGFTRAERIPEVHPQFTIVQSGDVDRLQTGFRTVDRLGTALPFIALGLLALGVYIARGHRKALIWVGLGVAISMVLLGAALALARTIYLDGLPETVSAPAAADVFDTLVRFLRAGLRTVAVAGLAVAAAAFLSGPSTTAVRTRAAFKSGIGRLRRLGETAGVRTGPVGAWSYRNRSFLRGGVVVVASLAFIFWDRPTGKVVLLIAGLAVVALAVVEFLARPPDIESAGGAPPETPAPA